MRLRELRRKHKLTQTQLGAVIGKSAPTLHRLETGQSPLTLPTLRKLATFFGITIAELIDEPASETSANGLDAHHV